MNTSIDILMAYAGSEFEKEDTTLRENVSKFLQTAKELGATTEFCDLNEHFCTEYIGNARPSKEIRPGLQSLASLVRVSEIVVLATPVHWRIPSMNMVAFVHLVLAPLEWGGRNNGGYECLGKTCGIFTVFDDDGAAMVESSLNDTLGHMGFDRPRFNTHHTNIKAFESEDDWQKEPEELARILVNFVRGRAVSA